MPLYGDREREYDRQWVAGRRAAWFAEKHCAWCEATENLELDHIDPRQKITHRIWSWRPERRDAELAKCRILCGDCHKKRTKAQQSVDYPHGTAGRYSRWCRCRPCTDAAVAMSAWYRRRKKALQGGMGVEEFDVLHPRPEPVLKPGQCRLV